MLARIGHKISLQKGLTTAGKDTIFLDNWSLKINEEIIEFDNPIVMGILNLTPDSFFDLSRIESDLHLLQRAHQMIEEGAEILDVGAYSSRPGAVDISESEEEKRLLSNLHILKKEFPKVLISVDTFRSGIAKKAIDHGAHIVNDISGGMLDEDMLETVASLKVPYIMMHMRGNPQNMQENLHYDNVVNDVLLFFSKQVEKARKLGIHDIIIDPGFGFGKDLEDNYRLLKSLNTYKSLNCMILAGISRKSMVNKVLNVEPSKALNGTIALNTLALLNGANIIRVHDIKAAKDAVKIVSYYQNV